jgi:hypothetical protein
MKKCDQTQGFMIFTVVVFRQGINLFDKSKLNTA